MAIVDKQTVARQSQCQQTTVLEYSDANEQENMKCCTWLLLAFGNSRVEGRHPLFSQHCRVQRAAHTFEHRRLISLMCSQHCWVQRMVALLEVECRHLMCSRPFGVRMRFVDMKFEGWMLLRSRHPLVQGRGVQFKFDRRRRVLSQHSLVRGGW